MRDLGSTALRIPPLVLGGNVFAWTIKDNAASHRLLDHFADRGGGMIDTAEIYSAWVPGHQGGESEAIIGDWIKASGKRDKVLIATKVGMWRDGNPPLERSRILAAVDKSLARLRVEAIDLYYAHEDDPDTPQEEVLATFEMLIKAGKVREIGASNFHAARFKSALDVATREGLPHFRVLQPEYSLVGRTGFEGELQDLCVAHNIGVVPYYALAAGYLTGKYRSAADFGKSVRGGRMAGYLEGNGPAVLAAMDQLAAETGATLAQIALAWVDAQSGVTAPIASATSIEQLDELLAFPELKLTGAQLDRLTNASTATPA